MKSGTTVPLLLTFTYTVGTYMYVKGNGKQLLFIQRQNQRVWKELKKEERERIISQIR